MLELRADCSKCFGLCCIAPAFAKSADFAIDKPAGTPCPNLTGDYRCGIHESLRDKGFKGCTVYDCFGAGQHVSQVTFGGRHDPRILEVFPIMGRLHELAYYLTEAGEGKELLAEIEELTRLDADALLALDLKPYLTRVDEVLTRVSSLARQGLSGPDWRGADLVGADLRGRDLRGANLRGTRLIGADLRKADLRRADLLGADLRGADLRGAVLTGAIFLTQSQLDSAAHWQ